MKIVLASLGFACVLAQSITSFAADENSCVKLAEGSVPKVCVGDLVRSRQDHAKPGQVVAGTVSKLEAAVSEDGRPMNIVTIQTKEGVSRLTTRGFVFVTPGTCVQDSRSQDRVCLGDEFKSEDDGRTYKVLGFAVNDGESLGSSGVVVQDLADKAGWERTFSASTIFESHAVAATGKMSRVGSCDSEIPYLDKVGYGHLPGCAQKEAVDRLKSSCSAYCAGKGGVKKGDVENLAKPSCDISPNMFPPHKKVCTTTITAACRCDQ